MIILCMHGLLGTLTRRLAFFDIKYIRYVTDIEDVENTVREEMEGPGQLLGYRATHHKIREQHQLHVPRNLVHHVKILVDPEGLEQ